MINGRPRLAYTALLGSLLIPGIGPISSRPDPAKFTEFESVRNVIVKRGYSEIKGLRKSTPEEREQFETIEKAAGLDHVNLLIGISEIAYAGAVVANPAYPGVREDYVIISEPEMKALMAYDPEIAEAHEFYHVIIERAKNRPYESFTDREVKQIELDADGFACSLIGDKTAMQAHLHNPIEYNEQIQFKRAAFGEFLFPNVQASIRESFENGGTRHPSLDERVRNIDILSRDPANTCKPR